MHMLYIYYMHIIYIYIYIYIYMINTIAQIRDKTVSAAQDQLEFER